MSDYLRSKYGMIVIFFMISWSLNAQVDPLNTYQFNRANHILGNGKVKQGPWFEWWYYKVILPEENQSFYFVYGVVNPADVQGQYKGTRSYVGMGDFSLKKTVEQKYDLAQFQASYDQTYVEVGPHVATDQNLSGELVDEQGQIYRWDISIQKKWAFNATGWITGLNITNIEWYPAQADALCSGWIESAGRLYQFSETPCYQDRNWGQSFPAWWTWIVSNHFEGHPDTTLAIGGGRPRVGEVDLGIEGVAVGLRHKGVEYDFRPNSGDYVWTDIRFGKWEVVVSDGKYKLDIKAWAPLEKFLDLQFMTPKGVVFHDYETLEGEVEVKLYRRDTSVSRRYRWIHMETLKSHWAGIEYGSHEVY